MGTSVLLVYKFSKVSYCVYLIHVARVHILRSIENEQPIQGLKLVRGVSETRLFQITINLPHPGISLFALFDVSKHAQLLKTKQKNNNRILNSCK